MNPSVKRMSNPKAEMIADTKTAGLENFCFIPITAIANTNNVMGEVARNPATGSSMTNPFGKSSG
jgi:hypothetical protein